MSENTEKAPITVTHVISGDLWAGAEVQVFNLCKALSRGDGVTVTAVLFNQGMLHDKLVALGVPVTLADERSIGPLRIARIISNHCRVHGTSIIHTHGFKENVLGILGKELARVRYSVRTVHGNPEIAFSWKQPLKWAISRLDVWLGRLRQQAIIAVSTQLATSLKRDFPGKVRKIYNFVDLEDVQKIEASRERYLGSSRLLLGLVGRLVPVKRADIFIKTVQRLNEQGYRCNGVIIGSGPLENRLKLLASDLGISNLIDFKGFVDPVAKEISKLTALIMPSDHEGLPMTLLETTALGIPVVAHKVGGIPEVIGDWQYGFLVEEHNPTGYSDAVIAGLDEIHHRQEICGAQYLTTRPPGFDERFTSCAGAKLYTQLYDEISTQSGQLK